MKRAIIQSILTAAIIVALSACGGRKGPKEDTSIVADTTSVPDTGYTGIKQYMSLSRLIKEVTFKNGVRHGLMKSFYEDGRVRQTFWYENGLREDSSRWYYLEGQLFRTTPYKHDTVDGISKQYYRTGKVKAKIGYSKGFRTTYFEEFTPDGKLVKGYPDLLVSTTDEYKTRGVYKITLSLSDKSERVKYYLGDMSDGVFDTTKIRKVNHIKGIATINLKKTTSGGSNSLGVIAEILTNFGNNRLVYKKIDLPYSDLK